MAVISGPPYSFSQDDMIALLANFAAWLYSPYGSDRYDMVPHDAAVQYLGGAGYTRPKGHRQNVPEDCELCRQRIPIAYWRSTEQWTGESLLLCRACYEAQGCLVARIGLVAYRQRWRDLVYVGQTHG